MRTTRFDGSDQRVVLIGMITSTVTLSRIATQWTPEGLFDAKYANLIGHWCVKYLKSYAKAPGRDIEEIFRSWARRTSADDETIQAVERLLLSLSDQHTTESDDYLIDVAGDLFNRIRLEKDIELAKLDLEQGRVKEAQERFRNQNQVNLGLGSYIDAAAQPEAWQEAFNKDRLDTLLDYPGPLGEFTRGSFTRGSLYAFLAPDKTGKTTWLLDFAYRGVRSRNRVAFFDTGDSNENEVIQKLAIRSTGQPEYEGLYNLPCDFDENGPVIVETHLNAIDPMDSYRQFKRVCQDDKMLRISCHRNSTLSVHDLDAILTDWGRAGWHADIVVIDYSDILAFPKGVVDPIQAIDTTWKYLRRISQERHALVMTATQTKSTGYQKGEKDVLNAYDFSGSKSKNAHVNGILTLNVSQDEKAKGMCRVGWAVRRKGAYSTNEVCTVAGSMALCNPAIVSRL